jgi:hypothetical protein
LDTASVSLARGLRRLSRREYNNTVRDLLGDSTNPGDRFGLEVYVNGFDNGSDGLTVGGTDVDAFQAAAEGLAARAVATRLATLTGNCDPLRDEAACVTAFLETFPRRAYRRPPTDTELERLRSVYSAGARLGGFAGGVQLVLEAILQSPAFLYRSELGLANSAVPGEFVRLTDDEVASELSFLITGSMPDVELFAAVDRGALKTQDDLRREAIRLMASPAAKPAFRSFLHQWLATDRLSSVAKDAVIYPAFNPPMAASMASELDAYFDDVLWVGEGSLRELFTSTRSFIDPNLAVVYGLPPPKSGFQAVDLDPQTRKGVLTRAGFLATHADSDSSGPIPRGVFVLNALLCDPPAPPPPDIPLPPPVATSVEKHQTTRQRFDEHVSSAACMGCHSVIDGVGFGFEQFDGIGVHRATENGSPVDTSGELLGSDVDGAFVGASELGTKLASSDDVRRCFVKQVYRFAMGQGESSDAAVLLNRLQSRFTNESHMTDAFLALVLDPSFILRTTARTSVLPQGSR